MKDFEVSAQPVQDWLSSTEKMVRGSSDRLYDLPAKRREQQKLQVMRLGPRGHCSPILCVALFPCVPVPASTGTWCCCPETVSPFPISDTFDVSLLSSEADCFCPVVCPTWSSERGKPSGHTDGSRVLIDFCALWAKASSAMCLSPGS